MLGEKLGTKLIYELGMGILWVVPRLFGVTWHTKPKNKSSINSLRGDILFPRPDLAHFLYRTPDNPENAHPYMSR